MRVVQLKGGFELVARTEELHGLIDRSNTHDRAKKKKDEQFHAAVREK